MTWLTSKTFAEIRPGDHASLTRILTRREIELFALSSGDFNPFHLDDAFAKNGMFHGVIAHGLWTASLISAVLGTKLPGPGTVYLAQTLRFLRPVRPGDEIIATVTVIKKYVRKPVLNLACQCINQQKKIVLTGVAKVLAPNASLRIRKVVLPPE
jgi:phosphate acetyltransferase